MARTKGERVINVVSFKPKRVKGPDYDMKQLWREYDTTIIPVINALKKKIKNMDQYIKEEGIIDPDTMCNMYRYSEMIFKEVKRVEEEMKKKQAEFRKGARIVYCNLGNYNEIKSEETGGDDTNIFRLVEGDNMFEGYQGEECVVMTKSESEKLDSEHIYLNVLASDKPVEVDNGERMILFTPRVIIVVDEEIEIEEHNPEEEEIFLNPMKKGSIKME